MYGTICIRLTVPHRPIYNAPNMGKWIRLGFFVVGLVLAIVCGIQGINLVQNNDSLIASGAMTTDQWLWATWRNWVLFSIGFLVMLLSLILFRKKYK